MDERIEAAARAAFDDIWAIIAGLDTQTTAGQVLAYAVAVWLQTWPQEHRALGQEIFNTAVANLLAKFEKNPPVLH